MKSAVASTEKIRTWVEHTLDQPGIELHLNTNIHNGPVAFQGLTDDEAHLRIAKYGLNLLTEHKGLPWPIKYLLEFTGLFNLMLWFSSLLCFIAFGL